MMGAGKSTIGPRLAERLGRVFLDTDREIERAAGCSIPTLFATEGEAHFRALEVEAIERAAESGGVVALGGGAIAQPGAPDRLRALGVVVFLRVDPSVLIERLGEGDDRPLLAGLGRAERIERLRTLLSDRAADYARATIEVDAAQSTERVVDEIVAALHDRTVASAGGSGQAAGQTHTESVARAATQTPGAEKE